MQAASETDPDAGSIWLAADGARAEIARHGAELRRWQVAGRELIWTPDPAVWTGTAPILFPVVGWTRDGSVRVGADHYRLGLHGFAHQSEFSVEAADAASTCFGLTSTPATLAIYPFAFRLSVTYRLAPSALSIELSVENTGAGPMPYACGLHPGFRWPFAGGMPAEYRVVFDAEEATDVPVITAAGLFSDRRRLVPLAGRTLALTSELFAAEALCFLDARSRGLSFARDGGPVLRVETENFPHVALWSRPGAPFLAIEAWTGHGDPDGYAGDLFEKPSMTILPPAARAVHRATFSFEAGAAT